MSPAIFGLACLPWPPSAAGSSAAIFVIPSTRRLSASNSARCAPVISPGTLQFLRPGRQFLGFDAQLVDLDLDVQRRLARGARQRREQGLGDLRVGFLGDFADVWL